MESHRHKLNYGQFAVNNDQSDPRRTDNLRYDRSQIGHATTGRNNWFNPRDMDDYYGSRPQEPDSREMIQTNRHNTPNMPSFGQDMTDYNINQHNNPNTPLPLSPLKHLTATGNGLGGNEVESHTGATNTGEGDDMSISSDDNELDKFEAEPKMVFDYGHGESSMTSTGSKTHPKSGLGQYTDTGSMKDNYGQKSSRANLNKIESSHALRNNDMFDYSADRNKLSSTTNKPTVFKHGKFSQAETNINTIGQDSRRTEPKSSNYNEVGLANTYGNEYSNTQDSGPGMDVNSRLFTMATTESEERNYDYNAATNPMPSLLKLDVKKPEKPFHLMGVDMSGNHVDILDDDDPEHFEAQIFVGNIHNNANQKYIQPLTCDYRGAIVWVAQHKSTGKNIAFVKLPSRKIAKRMISEKNNKMYKGCKLLVRYTAAQDFEDYILKKEGCSTADTENLKGSQIYNVFVDNLPANIPLDDFKMDVRNYPYRDVQVVRSDGKATGIISFYNKEDATNICSKLDGVTYFDQLIKASVVMPGVTGNFNTNDEIQIQGQRDPMATTHDPMATTQDPMATPQDPMMVEDDMMITVKDLAAEAKPLIDKADLTETQLHHLNILLNQINRKAHRTNIEDCLERRDQLKHHIPITEKLGTHPKSQIDAFIPEYKIHFNMLNHYMIGLQYITEIFDHPEHRKQKVVYRCHLCGMHLASNVITHIVGVGHRFKYLQLHEPEQVALIAVGPLSKHHKKEQCLNKAKQIEKEDGRSQILSVNYYEYVWLIKNGHLKETICGIKTGISYKATFHKTSIGVPRITPANPPAKSSANPPAKSILNPPAQQTSTAVPVTTGNNEMKAEFVDVVRRLSQLKTFIPDTQRVSTHPDSRLELYMVEWKTGNPDDVAMLGLQYITEIIDLQNDMASHTYYCSLCDEFSVFKVITSHITGPKHRTNVFEIYDTDVYNLIKNVKERKLTTYNLYCVNMARKCAQRLGKHEVLTCSTREFDWLMSSGYVKVADISQLNTQTQTAQSQYKGQSSVVGTQQGSQAGNQKNTNFGNRQSSNFGPHSSNIGTLYSSSLKSLSKPQQKQPSETVIVQKGLSVEEFIQQNRTSSSGRPVVRNQHQKKEMKQLSLVPEPSIIKRMVDHVKKFDLIQKVTSHEGKEWMEFFKFYTEKKLAEEVPLGLNCIVELRHRPYMFYTFYCKLCVSHESMNLTGLERHLTGAGHVNRYLEKYHPSRYRKIMKKKYFERVYERNRHIKELSTSTKRVDIKVAIVDDSMGEFFDLMKDVKITIVGLNHVTEIQPMDSSCMPASKYDCDLCFVNNCSAQYIKEHLTGFFHQLKFMSNNYPVLHERCVKDHSLVARYVGEIIEEFGCPANIMVKRVISYKNNLPGYSKPRSVEAPESFKRGKYGTPSEIKLKPQVKNDEKWLEDMNQAFEMGRNMAQYLNEQKNKDGNQSTMLTESELQHDNQKGSVFSQRGHNTAIADQMEDPNRSPMKRSNFDYLVAKNDRQMLNNPLLGLQYITETQQAEGPSMYECSLCFQYGTNNITSRNIMNHICSRGHKMKFFKETYEHMYLSIVSNSNMEDVNLALNKYSREIESKIGRGIINKIPAAPSTVPRDGGNTQDTSTGLKIQSTKETSRDTRLRDKRPPKSGRRSDSPSHGRRDGNDTSGRSRSFRQRSRSPRRRSRSPRRKSRSCRHLTRSQETKKRSRSGSHSNDVNIAKRKGQENRSLSGNSGIKGQSETENSSYIDVSSDNDGNSVDNDDADYDEERKYLMDKAKSIISQDTLNTNVTELPQIKQLGLAISQYMGLPNVKQMGVPQRKQMDLPQNQKIGMPQGKQLGMPQGNQIGKPLGRQNKMPQSKQTGFNQPMGLPQNQQMGLEASQQIGFEQNQQFGYEKSQQLGFQLTGFQQSQQMGLPQNQPTVLQQSQQLGLQQSQQMGLQQSRLTVLQQSQQIGLQQRQLLGLQQNHQTGLQQNQQTGLQQNQQTGLQQNQQTGIQPSQQMRLTSNQLPGLQQIQQFGLQQNQQFGLQQSQHLGLQQNQQLGLQQSQQTGLQQSQHTGLPQNQPYGLPVSNSQNILSQNQEFGLPYNQQTGYPLNQQIELSSTQQMGLLPAQQTGLLPTQQMRFSQNQQLGSASNQQSCLLSPQTMILQSNKPASLHIQESVLLQNQQMRIDLPPYEHSRLSPNEGIERPANQQIRMMMNVQEQMHLTDQQDMEWPLNESGDIFLDQPREKPPSQQMTMMIKVQKQMQLKQQQQIGTVPAHLQQIRKPSKEQIEQFLKQEKRVSPDQSVEEDIDHQMRKPPSQQMTMMMKVQKQMQMLQEQQRKGNPSVQQKEQLINQQKGRQSHQIARETPDQQMKKKLQVGGNKGSSKPKPNSGDFLDKVKPHNIESTKAKTSGSSLAPSSPPNTGSLYAHIPVNKIRVEHTSVGLSNRWQSETTNKLIIVPANHGPTNPLPDFYGLSRKNKSRKNNQRRKRQRQLMAKQLLPEGQFNLNVKSPSGNQSLKTSLGNSKSNVSNNLKTETKTLPSSSLDKTKTSADRKMLGTDIIGEKKKQTEKPQTNKQTTSDKSSERKNASETTQTNKPTNSQNDKQHHSRLGGSNIDSRVRRDSDKAQVNKPSSSKSYRDDHASKVSQSKTSGKSKTKQKIETNVDIIINDIDTTATHIRVEDLKFRGYRQNDQTNTRRGKRTRSEPLSNTEEDIKAVTKHNSSNELVEKHNEEDKKVFKAAGNEHNAKLKNNDDFDLSNFVVVDSTEDNSKDDNQINVIINDPVTSPQKSSKTENQGKNKRKNDLKNDSNKKMKLKDDKNVQQTYSWNSTTIEIEMGPSKETCVAVDMEEHVELDTEDLQALENELNMDMGSDDEFDPADFIVLDTADGDCD